MHRLHLGSWIFALMLAAATTTVYAVHDTECLKAKGVAACVQTFAAENNQALDLEMRQRGVSTKETTKVVPIVDIGIGQTNPARATIGAAQVAGPTKAIEKVQAVARFDKGLGDAFFGRVLVPTDSREPWKKLQRVAGVSVSVIIIAKGCKAWPDTPPDGCR